MHRVSLHKRIENDIRRSRRVVFLRSDFRCYGGYQHVGRTLTRLVHAGILIRVSHGVYAKTRLSSITGSPIPVRSLSTLAKQALKRLGIRTARWSQAEIDYNSGRSTQVPIGRVIAVHDCTRRRFQYKTLELIYEDAAALRS